MKSECFDEIRLLLGQYKKVSSEQRLLMVPFTSLADYLWMLRVICERLGNIGPRVLLYLAAAVSDFYIPASEMPQHKIQSAIGAPKLELQLVPKMLHPLVKNWVPNAYVISFKLETDPELLEQKARKALETYQHQMVIANLLKDRKIRVRIIEKGHGIDETKGTTIVELNEDEIKGGKEIEEKIVCMVCEVHKKFYASSKNDQER